MRKIIFVLLKLVEIPIIVFVPYWVFNFVDKGQTATNWFGAWLLGLGAIAVVAAIIVVACFCCYGLYKGNQKLAEWITNKII